MAKRGGRDGGPSALMLWSNTGAGKTFLAAWAVRRAVLGGVFQSLCWVTERELIGAAKRAHTDDPEPREVIKSARECELLVVDELFSDPVPTHAYHDDGGRLMRSLAHVRDLFWERLGGRKPMLLTSNHGPVGRIARPSHDAPAEWFDDENGTSVWALVFDSRTASRWAAAGRAVACNGPDMRMNRGA